MTTVLWQHGFELPSHSVKVTVQLGDDRTMREVRAVHVVGYQGHAKPSPACVLGSNKKPKTEGGDSERCHPGRDGIAAQATEEPGGDRRHKPDATDQNYVVPHDVCWPGTFAWCGLRFAGRHAAIAAFSLSNAGCRSDHLAW